MRWFGSRPFDQGRGIFSSIHVDPRSVRDPSLHPQNRRGQTAAAPKKHAAAFVLWGFSGLFHSETDPQFRFSA